MIKSLFVLMILCLTVQGQAQETDASQLVKLLHQTDMDSRLEFLQQFQSVAPSEKMKDSTALAKSLYTGIEAVYQKQFTPKELKGLYAFYSSPLGTKLLQQQAQLNSEVSTVAYKWEMEQQGITVEDLETPIFNDKEDELMEPNAETIAEEVAPKVEKIPLPKIATLDDLKSLLRKDPFIIADQNILLALFGKKELDTVFEQLMEEQGAEPMEEEEIEPKQ